MRSLALLTLAASILTSINAHAQSSTQRVKQDRHQQYSLIKRAFKETFPYQPSSRPNIRETYDLSDCTGADPRVVGGEQIAILAAEISTVSDMLNWLGYPKSLWQDRLRDFEQQQLNRPNRNAVHAFANKLVVDLNNYRKTTGTRLAPVQWDTECGGRGMPLKIVTSPKGGDVRLLPMFYYNVCRLQNIDPDNPTQCDRWEELSDGEETLLQGVYRYMASWPNGQTKRGRQDFDRFPEDQSVWTIRASQ